MPNSQDSKFKAHMATTIKLAEENTLLMKAKQQAEEETAAWLLEQNANNLFEQNASQKSYWF